MAKEDLLVNIEVDSKPAKRGVDQLNKSLSANTKQAKKIQAELQKLEKEYKSIATAIKKLPAQEVEKLGRASKKAEKAAKGLSKQMERTGDKVNVVRERVIGTEEVFGTLIATVITMGKLDAPIAFANKIYKATNAVQNFNKTVVPTVKNSIRLIETGYRRAGKAVGLFQGVFKTAGGAIQEQIAIRKGFNTVLIHSNNLIPKFNEALSVSGKSAIHFERGLVGVRTFIKETKTGISRVEGLMTALSGSVQTTGKIFGGLGKAMFGTFGRGSGGAAQVNLLQQAMLNLQFASEMAGMKITKAFSTVSSSISQGVNKTILLAKAVGTIAVDKGITLLTKGFQALPGVLTKVSNALGGVQAAASALKARGFADIVSGGTKVASKMADIAQKAGVMNRGLLGAIEGGHIFGIGLLGLGSILKKSENSVINFMGSVIQLAGVLSFSFATALTIAIGAVGGFIAAVGGKLIATMNTWEDKFTKAQETTSAFEFTIKGFGKTLGVEAVGSLEFWNQQVENMSNTTANSAVAVQKSIKILIAEGQALGLTAAQNAEILKRVSDISAGTGADLERVALSVAKALAGNGSSLQDLGVFTDKATLEHSKFAHTLNKSVDAMDKHEKALLVMNSIFEQAVPLTGAAAAKLDTISGANERLAKSVETLQAKLGAQSPLFAKLTNVQSEFVGVLNSMPPVLFDVVSTLVDFSGVALVTAGTFISLSVTIFSLSTAMSGFNGVLAAGGRVQAGVNILVGVLSTRMNVATVSVVSLKTAMIAFGQLAQGAAIKGLITFKAGVTAAAVSTKAFAANLLLTRAGWASMISGAATATAAVGRFTLALLTNPLFLKGAAIVTVIFAAVEAISQLREELGLTATEMEKVGEQTSIFSEALKAVGGFFKRAFQGVVNVLKIIFIGFLKLWESVKLVGLALRKLTSYIPGMSKIAGTAEDIDGEFSKTILTLGDLGDEMDKITSGGVAMAASFDKAGKAAHTAVAATKGFFSLSQGASEGLRIEVSGSDVEKAVRKFEELDEVFKRVKSQGVIQIGTELLLPTTENLNKMSQGLLDKGGVKPVMIPATLAESQQITTERERAWRQMVDLRRKNLAGIKEQTNDLALRELEANGKMIAAIEARGAAEVARIRKQLAEQKKLPDISKAELNIFHQRIAAAKRATELEKQSKATELLKNFQDLMAGVVGENQKLTDDLNKSHMTTAEHLRAQLEQQLKILDIKALEFQANKALSEAQKKALLEQIELQKKLLATKTSQEVSAAEKESARKGSAVERFQKFTSGDSNEQQAGGGDVMNAAKSIRGAMSSGAGDLKDAFSQFGTVSSGAVSGMMGAVGGFMAVADAMLDFAQKMIDFIPNMLDKMIKIFDSLTDLPGKVADKFIDLGRAMENAVRNFIPNLIKNFQRGMKGFFDSLFGGMMDAIGDMFDGIGDALADELSTFPEMFGKVIEKAFGGAGVNRMVNKFIGMFPKIWKAFIKGVPMLVKAIINGLLNGMKGLINEIARALGRGKIFNLPKDIDKSMSKLGKKMGKANEQLFRVLDLEAEAKAAKLQTELDPERIGRSVWDAIKRAFMQARDFFNNLGSMIWMGFFQPVVDFFKKKGEELWLGLKEEINKNVFFLKALGAKIWEGFKELTGPIDEWMKQKGMMLWNGLQEMTEPFDTWMKEKGTMIWNGLQEQAAPINQFFGEIGAKLWDSFVNGFNTVRDGFGNIISNIITTFQNAFQNLPKDMEAAFNKLNPSSFLSKVFKVDGKGRGQIETNVIKVDVPWANFAFGGLVKGGGGGGGLPPGPSLPGDSKLNDTIPALLSAGEAIIPKSLMGVPEINGLITAILNGEITSLGDMKDLIIGPLFDGMREQMFAPRGFSEGGIVGRSPMAAAMSGGGTKGSVANNFNFDINLSVEASSQSLDATFIRNKLIPDLKKELKQSSLRGEFIMSDRGLR